MIRLRFTIPIVLDAPSPLTKCPFCGSGIIRHQTTVRGLTDFRVGSVTVVRFKCKACRRTFTHRPRGVTRSSKSDRIKAASVMAYCLGMSFDAVSNLMRALGAPVAKTYIYNYVRAAGAMARRLHLRNCPKDLVALGQDTTVFKVKGKERIVSCITDAFHGKIVAIDFLDHEDVATLKKCLRKVVGTETILLVSDDADAYKVVAEGLGLKHQLCIAHMKKALIRRSQDIVRSTPKDYPMRATVADDCRRLRKMMRSGNHPSIRVWSWAKRRFFSYAGVKPLLQREVVQAPGTGCV